MLENEENKMNTENNESEVKNESNIENVATVKNDAEDSATNKATEEMFEESDFVTPPQDVKRQQMLHRQIPFRLPRQIRRRIVKLRLMRIISKEPRALPSTVIPTFKNHQKQDHGGW